MIFLIFKIIVLLGVIIIPLKPPKTKVKIRGKLKANRNTKGAQYAINDNGTLEEIHKRILT